MKMDTEKRRMLISVSIFFCFLLFLTACSGNVTASPVPIPVPTITVELPTITSTPLPQPPVPTATPSCTDGLSFVNDVTIPDNTIVAPGNSLDKQWLVQNSGSCNWDNRYRLRLISGDPLGATTEQALYPARAGAQATLHIIFTAPADSGTYVSEWQAFDPNGLPFGDSFFIKINVSP
jgi:hypothetical protein